MSAPERAPDTAEESRDEWDRHWALYGEPAHGNPANTYRHRLVLDLLGELRAGDRVLDIGSGQGELALLLKRRFPAAKVAGVEYSAEGVQRAEAAADTASLRVDFVQRDLLEPATLSPDVAHAATHATCSEVLEHVDDPGLLLRNAAAYLAPGCRLVVTVPGGPRSAFDEHIGHRQHFTPATLRTLLAGAGFDVVRVARAGFPFFNLYRLAVILRGRKLIADLESPTSDGGAGAQGVVLTFFDRAFRLNLASTPFGWQMVAVARYPRSGGSGVIISRTPLRITLGGGGTDLPSYYGDHGGFVISAAVNRYIFIAINRTFSDDYTLKYSELERVPTVAEITHPLIREALRLHPVGPAIELVSVADIPAGTGLGSSGSFTVGLLRALYAYKRQHVTAANLAEEACRIEIETLDRPVGKQDQYIAAFGGLTCLDIARDGNVTVSPLRVSNDTLRDLEEHLCMFFTHYSRPADLVLDEQRTKSKEGDAEMLDSLHFVKENGLATKAALESGDTDRFAALMDEHWQRKRQRSALMSNERIDRCYNLAKESGALGGKLVGAGSGGFLLFYAKDLDSLRTAMAGEGLSEVRFTFDFDGSTLMVRD